MARTPKIQRRPTAKYFYLVDANFLVNRFIPYARVIDAREKNRVIHCQDWWIEIDAQLRMNQATVYVPDLCVAESFKVLARKYYAQGLFHSSAEYKFSRDQLAGFVRTSPKFLKSARRHIRVHDIATSRDVIIAVDRFYEIFWKNKLSASVIDLVILATAKHLIDFYSIPRDRLFIVTMDDSLWRGSKKCADVPRAFNPNAPREKASDVFEG